MDQPPEINSPLLQAPPTRLSVKTVRLLLIAVVGAGIGCLIWYALQVPAIASELDHWLGRPVNAADTPEGRRTQVIFLLLVYSAPLALGALVYLANYVTSGFDRRRKD